MLYLLRKTFSGSSQNSKRTGRDTSKQQQIISTTPLPAAGAAGVEAAFNAEKALSAAVLEQQQQTWLLQGQQQQQL